MGNVTVQQTWSLYRPCAATMPATIGRAVPGLAEHGPQGFALSPSAYLPVGRLDGWMMLPSAGR